MPSTLYFREKYGQLGDEIHYNEGNSSKVVGLKEYKKQKASKSILAWLGDWIRYVLLPQGYPASVSGDYLSYQLWDTLQAFCSYLSGTLTTKAIMQGVGVGDIGATPLAATITWIMRDGTGMIGRIVFASWKGPSLDANCKQWRLAADLLNDMAMTIELCSPMLPEQVFPWALCVATSLKSIVGVAGGATRAALTQHQARRGNMADVAAKDGSQETLVNLVASIVGIFMLPLLTSDMYAWLLFAFLTCVHLFANYKAVRSLNIPILNAQRFNLLMMTYLKSSEQQVDSPLLVNSKESVFLATGMSATQVCGFEVELGASLSSVPDASAEQLSFACSLGNEYLVLPSFKRQTVAVIFQQGSTPLALKAYYHAILLAIRIDQVKQKVSKNKGGQKDKDLVFEALSWASDAVADSFAEFVSKAEGKGWLMSRHQLLVDEWQAVWSLKKLN